MRETGLAALIATHNMELAARMDRVVRLDKGRLGLSWRDVVPLLEPMEASMHDETRCLILCFDCGPCGLPAQNRQRECRPVPRISPLTVPACHGTGGKGDGEVAETLEKNPANLTSLAARNKGRFR